jgi:hypothetical protein
MDLQIRLDALPGTLPPPDTFVSMRIGDVQKKTRFENSRTYRFPEPKDKRGAFARIEVFKRIGSTTVSLDNYREDSPCLDVPCSFPNLDKLSFNMSVFGGLSSERPESREKKKKTRALQRMDDAQHYLASYRLEETLADAMRQVIRDRPEDPYEGLSAFLLKHRGQPLSPQAAKPPSKTMRSEKPQEAKAPNAVEKPKVDPVDRKTVMPEKAQEAKAPNAVEKPKVDPVDRKVEPVIPKPSTALLPFAAYYKSNFTSVNANTGLYSGFHTRPVNEPKPAVAIDRTMRPPPKAVTKDTEKSPATQANVQKESVLHLRNVAANSLAEAALSGKLQELLPKQAGQNTGGAVERLLSFASLIEEASATDIADGLCGLTSNDRTRLLEACNLEAMATSAKTSEAKADSTVQPVESILPFSAYYTEARFGSVTTDIQIYSKFHKNPVPLPKIPPPFSQKPSVGTWLGYKPSKEVPKRPFGRLPSVGTWLTPVETLENPTTLSIDLEAIEEVPSDPRGPFHLSPSGGTWLMKKSPDINHSRPWHFRQHDHGEHTEYVRGLQKVIASKDDEVEQLKAELARLKAT